MKATRTCSIDDCEKPHNCRGWCLMHYLRWWRHGDPLLVLPKANYRGDDLDYGSAHARVKVRRGAAKGYACTHCGQTARDWAYDHLDPAERTGGPTGKLRFSTDPDHYMPLCKPCHRRFDDSKKES